MRPDGPGNLFADYRFKPLLRVREQLFGEHVNEEGAY